MLVKDDNKNPLFENTLLTLFFRVLRRTRRRNVKNINFTIKKKNIFLRAMFAINRITYATYFEKDNKVFSMIYIRILHISPFNFD